MSPFRMPAGPEVPEFLWEPSWHERLRCRLLGHALWSMFMPRPHGAAVGSGYEFPSYCSRCGRTETRGYSDAEYWEALARERSRYGW